MLNSRLVTQVADPLAAGAAVGFGVKMLTNMDLIVSIIAGVLVAASAGFSLYLNWKRRQEEKEKKLQDKPE